MTRRGSAVRVKATYAARHAEPMWAAQSGPMLVIDGALHPAIAADGPSRKIRNGVGARDAHTALCVISDTPVSFGRLARLFRDELHCRDALFLDGVVSSVWIRARSAATAVTSSGRWWSCWTGAERRSHSRGERSRAPMPHHA